MSRITIGTGAAAVMSHKSRAVAIVFAVVALASVLTSPLRTQAIEACDVCRENAADMIEGGWTYTETVDWLMLCYDINGCHEPV